MRAKSGKPFSSATRLAVCPRTDVIAIVCSARDGVRLSSSSRAS
jgi:hypothetical protein